MANLFNLFHDWCFSFCTETAKVVSVLKQDCTTHALINITENIRKDLDDKNIDCGIFVEL